MERALSWCERRASARPIFWEAEQDGGRRECRHQRLWKLAKVLTCSLDALIGQAGVRSSDDLTPTDRLERQPLREWLSLSSRRVPPRKRSSTRRQPARSGDRRGRRHRGEFASRGRTRISTGEAPCQNDALKLMISCYFVQGAHLALDGTPCSATRLRRVRQGRSSPLSGKSTGTVHRLTTAAKRSAILLLSLCSPRFFRHHRQMSSGPPSFFIRREG